MSNCIGVSGATRESRDRAAKFVDSDPKDPELLVRAVGGRDCPAAGRRLSCLCWKDGEGVTASRAD